MNCMLLKSTQVAVKIDMCSHSIEISFYDISIIEKLNNHFYTFIYQPYAFIFNKSKVSNENHFLSVISNCTKTINLEIIEYFFHFLLIDSLFFTKQFAWSFRSSCSFQTFPTFFIIYFAWHLC